LTGCEKAPIIFHMFSSAFVRRECGGVVFYACAALDKIPFMRHGFSTRHGGVSPFPERALNLSHVSWDESARVDENRRRFLAALDIPEWSLATLSQIHSDRVHIIEENPDQWNRRTQGDALVTRRAGVTLAVQVADCFPILIADPETRAVGSIHAGWRGTLARIVAKAVAKMRREFGCEPARMIAAIGPGVRACCFEVGAEVIEAFEKEFPGARMTEERKDHPEKYLLDLHSALAIQFEEAGFSPGNVFDLEACTRCNLDEFFSYRGEGPRSGRMMGLIAAIA